MSIDGNINESQKDNVNINKSEKLELSQSIPLEYILSAHHHLHLLQMANRMVIHVQPTIKKKFNKDIC